MGHEQAAWGGAWCEMGGWLACGATGVHAYEKASMWPCATECVKATRLPSHTQQQQQPHSPLAAVKLTTTSHTYQHQQPHSLLDPP